MREWIVLLILFVIAYAYSQIVKNVNLFVLPINWSIFMSLTIFFLVYSEIYMWLIRKIKWWHWLLFFPISLALCIFLIPIVLGIAKIKFDGIYDFFENVVNVISKHYILIIGFGIGTAIADQILHWILFGRGKSEFTLLISMSGTLLDELFMRLILLGILLNLGLELPTAIFLQALSYMVYYLDPTSKNRMRQASLNLMHGIIAGAITLKLGWILALAIAWIRIAVWQIENMIGK